MPDNLCSDIIFVCFQVIYTAFFITAAVLMVGAAAFIMREAFRRAKEELHVG